MDNLNRFRARYEEEALNGFDDERQIITKNMEEKVNEKSGPINNIKKI